MTAPRILIVEDDAVIAADIAGQLGALGYGVVDSVPDADGALASAERHRPDLLLMDIRLRNGRDGIEAAREVRRRLGTPVVFLTAYAEDETLERAKAAEPYGYIVKPFRSLDLKSAVEVALARRAAEEALRDSEERFRQMADAIEEVFWIGSADWNEVLYVNPAYEKVWGRSCDSLRREPRSWLEAVAEEDREAVRGSVNRLIGGAPPLPAGKDFRIDRPDGSRRWIHARVYALRDGQGKVRRVSGVAQDVSERMYREGFLDARLRLLEREARCSVPEFLVAVLDEAEALTGSRLGFLRFLEGDDEDIPLQAWSTATARAMAGMAGAGRHSPPPWLDVWNECVRQRRPVLWNDPESLPGKGPRPEAHPPVRRLLAAPAIRSDRVPVVLGLVNKGCDYGPEDAWAAEGFADLAWQITEKKRAEEALREKERSMEALLGNMPGMAYRCRNDDRWTMEYVSEGCQDLFGHPARDLEGDAQPGFFALVHADDVPMMREEIREALLQGRKYQLTYRIHARSGRTKWVWEQGKCISPPGVRPEILEGFVSDITERKDLEARLLHSQKMDAFGQLAGGVAHDFNNILAANMIHLSLLAMRTDLDEAMRTSLLEMQENARRGANLTRQLLLFSRRSAMEAKPVDLNGVVANMSRILGRIIGEHIEMKFRRGGGLPLVEADTGMLEQVLMNLAVNARDAMPKGGRIVIATELAELDAGAAAGNPDRRPGRFLRLSVSDTGHGMDRGTLERIFEPFFTTKKAGKGTGMGLATVHGIVAQHKGWIEVESEPDRGTTFRIHLPALEGASLGTEGPGTGKEEVPSGHETILLVEDERILRSMIVESLAELGYRILEASDGREAIGVWERGGPPVDLLLTDMVMPHGMSGLELSEELLKRKPDLKVIITSGYTGDMGHADLPRHGRVLFLPKPYNLTRLAQLVRECMEGRREPADGRAGGIRAS